MSTQVAETLQILATDSIVHYDLKAANVLVELLPGATQVCSVYVYVCYNVQTVCRLCVYFLCVRMCICMG